MADATITVVNNAVTIAPFGPGLATTIAAGALVTTPQSVSFLADPSAAFVTLLQEGTGAVARMLGLKLAEIKSVTDYGVATTASAASNLANFKLAVAACAVGDILDVPPHADPYLIDTSGGLSTAIEVNKRITIRLRGDVKATFSAIQANPPFIFNFTAAGSGIEGPGRVIGDGTVNALNDASATVDQNPGLVRLAADYTFCRSVGFVTVPKTGLLLYGGYYCDVSGNRFTGGITAYHSTSAASQTAYFGIYASAGGRHIIRDNFFYPDGSGGMLIQCMFSNGSTHNCEIVNNVASRPYEKLLYWFGSNNLVSGNIVLGNTGTIPGTNIQGTIGNVIRLHGANNRICNNYTSDCGGGVTCYDGAGNEIVDNTFVGCGNSGVAIIGATAALTQTRVDRNRITYSALVGQTVADGIEVTCSYAAASTQVSVCDNVVSGFSLADPIVNIPTWQASTAYNKISTVKPTVGNGRIYDPLTTTTGGTTAASEPTWPTTPGDTVVDGTVTWVARSYGGVRDSIRVTGNASGNITNSAMSHNNTYGDVNGINFEYVTDSTASFNDIQATTTCMEEANGARNRWFYNAARGGGTSTVVGIDATSTFITGVGSTSTTTVGTITTGTWNGTTIAVANGGTGVTTSTGTGAGVHAVSPSLTTPNIGAATGTSVTLTGGDIQFTGTGPIRSIGWGGNVSAGAANPMIYSDGNYYVMNSKAGSHLYLNFDNTDAASTVNLFNGKVVVKTNGDTSFTGTGALTVPAGTAAQRPTAVAGMIRYNTDGTPTLEAYINGAWKTIAVV